MNDLKNIYGVMASIGSKNRTDIYNYFVGLCVHLTSLAEKE